MNRRRRFKAKRRRAARNQRRHLFGRLVDASIVWAQKNTDV